MSSRILRFLIDVTEPDFELETRGPVLTFNLINSGTYIEIFVESYEYNEPVIKRYRIYETGQTISAGEYVTTVRENGYPALHIYEIK